MVLWAWNDHAVEKAKAVLEIAAQIPDVMIIPMPDYRPKYPKIDPEEVINPNHPNLTIWGNKIEACIFIGVHCHYANLTLKMIRAGTNCLDNGNLCGAGARRCDADDSGFGHDQVEEDRAGLQAGAEEMGIKLPENGENVRFTGTQSRSRWENSHQSPHLCACGGPCRRGCLRPFG